MPELTADSHAHVHFEQLAGDLLGVLDRARAASLDAIITVGTGPDENARVAELAQREAMLYAAVGFHPHEAKDFDEDRDLALFEELCASRRVVAVGEIGLDYHYDHSPRPVQQDVFRTQLSLAKELALPVVVHCREAIADVKNILREVEPERLVLHCCTERWEDAQELVERGYLLGFTGIATYPHAEVIRTVIERCPLDQILIETDAPYLAPVPHRGKRNEPMFVVEVAKLIAKLKGVSLEEVDRTTTHNAVVFYGLPS